MRYTQKWRLHHHPAPSMAPPPCTHKTGALQLRCHAFQPHPALHDDSPAHSGPNMPCAAIAGPHTATAKLYTPQHTCVSPTHQYSLLEFPSLILSLPVCIPSFHHACITIAPHQQHYATHMIPTPLDSTLPCQNNEQISPLVCIPLPGHDRDAALTFQCQVHSPCLSLVIQVQSFQFHSLTFPIKPLTIQLDHMAHMRISFPLSSLSSLHMFFFTFSLDTCHTFAYSILSVS
jgi:hypothetical protein